MNGKDALVPSINVSRYSLGTPTLLANGRTLHKAAKLQCLALSG